MATPINDQYKLQYSNQFSIAGIQEADVNLSLNTISNKTCNIIGVVTDGTKPIQDATVKIFDQQGTPYMHTLTDAEGQYSFNKIPTGIYTISAVKHGYIMSVPQGLSLSEGQTINVDMVLNVDASLTLGVVAGVVTDVNNVPLDGVNITLLDGNNQDVSNTVSIDDGEFTFYDIPPGNYSVIATTQGYLASNPVLVTVQPDGIVNIQIVLEIDSHTYLGTVSGVIRDNASNNIVPNAFVGLYLLVQNGDIVTEQLVKVGKTNAMGYYMFGDVPQGNYMVKAKVNK